MSLLVGVVAADTGDRCLCWLARFFSDQLLPWLLLQWLVAAMITSSVTICWYDCFLLGEALKKSFCQHHCSIDQLLPWSLLQWPLVTIIFNISWWGLEPLVAMIITSSVTTCCHSCFFSYHQLARPWRKAPPLVAMITSSVTNCCQSCFFSYH